MTAVTWTASNGSAIEITAQVGFDGPMVVAKIDGKETGSTYSLDRLPAPVKAGANLVVASIGKVGLTEERYQAVREMFSAARREWANTPDGLRARREALLEKIADARHEMDSTHRRRVEQASATGVVPPQTLSRAEIRERNAVAALAEFDVQHPEIVASIEAERDAATERNMWM